MKKIITLTLTLGLTSLLVADANIPMDKKAMKAKMTKIAGATSPFNKHENFPKDYFLIPKNLPFAIGLVLHHPKSSTLGLSKEQIAKLVSMKKEKQTVILKKAKEIKELELLLLNLLETNEGNQTKVSDKMSKLVDTIASKKAELTKSHLQCIIDVQNILTKEQREKTKSFNSIDINKKVSSNSMRTVFFPLKHYNSAVVRTKIKPLLGKEAKVISFKSNNMVVITAYPNSIKRVREVIEKIESTKPRDATIVKFKKASVSDIYQDIKSMSSYLFHQSIYGEHVNVIESNATNSLILVGKKENMNRLLKYIKLLDIEGGFTSKTMD